MCHAFEIAEIVNRRENLRRSLTLNKSFKHRRFDFANEHNVIDEKDENDHRFDNDKTFDFVDVTRVKTKTEKTTMKKVAAKEKMKRKDKISTTFRKKKIKKIKKTAI